MIRLLLGLFLLTFTFFSTAQTLCDSVAYSIGNSGNGTLILTGHTNTSSSTTVDSIMWDWQVCDAANCYTSSSPVATFTNLITTDSCALHIYVFIIANGDTCELNIEDTLLYGVNGWEVLEGHHLTFISEVQLEEYIYKDRMFDLFGREYFSRVSLKKGVYIQNKQLFFIREDY